MPKRGPALATLGLNIHKQREVLDYSQEKLAEQAGLDQTYISGIECGKRNPGIKNVARIAKALKVTTSELCEWGGGVRPSQSPRRGHIHGVHDYSPCSKERAGDGSLRTVRPGLRRKRRRRCALPAQSKEVTDLGARREAQRHAAWSGCASSGATTSTTTRGSGSRGRTTCRARPPGGRLRLQPAVRRTDRFGPAAARAPITFTVTTDGFLLLTWAEKAVPYYKLQSRPDLFDPDGWQDVPTGEEHTFTAPLDGDQTYYRLTRR